MACGMIQEVCWKMIAALTIAAKAVDEPMKITP
jgi:hypothetical protein